MEKFESKKHSKAVSNDKFFIMLSFVAEYSPVEQRSKLAAIFYPEKDQVRRGFLEPLTHFLK